MKNVARAIKIALQFTLPSSASYFLVGCLIVILDPVLEEQIIDTDSQPNALLLNQGVCKQR